MEANVFPARVPDEMLNTVSQSEVATKSKKVLDFVTKGQLLEMFCPVVFKYSTAEAIEAGMIAKFKTFIIQHRLDTTNRSIKTWKSYDRLGTEHDYYSKRNQQRLDWRKSKGSKMRMAREMVDLLYTLPSKTKVVKAILKRLEGEKTLIFGTRKDSLYEITPNVAEPDNYDELIEKFNSGEIKVIASCKLLKQGITLDGVQNIIFHSYTSKWHNMEQMRARVRWLDGEQAKLFFILTLGTFEEKWFGKLKVQKDSRGRVLKVHDLNVEGEIPSSKLISWYKTQTC